MAKTGNKVGRPTKMTPEVLRKIEEVAALDGSVAEMALYANVHVDTVYAYLAENKKFSDRIAALRERPILKARQTIVKSLEQPNYAFEYMKKKRKLEFGDAVDITSGGEPLVPFNNDQLTTIFQRRNKSGNTGGKGKSY